MSKNLDMATARATLGLTQARLAELLDVDRKYVSMIETGVKPLSAKMSKKLDILLRGVQNSPAPQGTGPPHDVQADMDARISKVIERLDAVETDLALIKKLLLK